MSQKIEMIGRRFNRLVVVSEEEARTKPSGQKTTMYKCICDCGNYVIVSGTHLRSGHNQSCGCLKEEQKTIGTDRLATIWRGMVSRCYSENNDSYPRYGAKGITVCESWKNDFKVFRSWALKHGYNDSLTLDRIDNSKGYEPINCRWESYKKQANNRKNNVTITFKGITHTITEWSDLLDINAGRLYRRKYKGMSDEEILNHFPEVADLLEKMREPE